MKVCVFSFSFRKSIVLGAFLLRSLSGFGSALLCIPLLSLFYSVKFIVPVECVLEVVLSLILLPRVYKLVNRRELLLLVGGAIIGSVLGAYVLASLADVTLKTILGIVIIVVATTLLKSPPSLNLPPWSGIVAGLAGGILGGMFGTSGPAYVAYLAFRIPEPRSFRATLIYLFAIEYSWRLLVYFYQGLLDIQGVVFALELIPALVIGALAGHRLHEMFPERSFRTLVALLLLLSGVLCFI